MSHWNPCAPRTTCCFPYQGKFPRQQQYQYTVGWGFSMTCITNEAVVFGGVFLFHLFFQMTGWDLYGVRIGRVCRYEYRTIYYFWSSSHWRVIGGWIWKTFGDFYLAVIKDDQLVGNWCWWSVVLAVIFTYKNLSAAVIPATSSILWNTLSTGTTEAPNKISDVIHIPLQCFIFSLICVGYLINAARLIACP